MSNISTTNPCGMPMPPLPTLEVPYGTIGEVDLTFNFLLKPPLRVYPVINNLALDGQQGKHEQVKWLYCPAPFDYNTSDIYRWLVDNVHDDKNVASVNGDPLDGWRWTPRDFIWFHVEELRNDTIGYGYQTTKNFTVVTGYARDGSGAAAGLNASKSAILLLAGLAVTALTGFTI